MDGEHDVMTADERRTRPANRNVPARITEYLSKGGLFNPELMDHEAVRDLLIDARDVIEIMERERRAPDVSAEPRCTEMSPSVYSKQCALPRGHEGPHEGTEHGVTDKWSSDTRSVTTTEKI